MRKIFGFLKNLIKVKKGQTAIEYALIVGGVAFVLYLAFGTLKDKFRGPDGYIQKLTDRLKEPITGE